MLCGRIENRLAMVFGLIAAVVVALILATACFPANAWAATLSKTITYKGGVYEVYVHTNSKNKVVESEVTYKKPTSKKKTSYVIPKTIKVKVGARSHTVPVKRIADKCFVGCSKMRKVKCNANLESIGEKAFYKCSKLESFVSTGGVETVCKRAFYGCKKLKLFKAKPKTLSWIADYAFYGCSKLTSIPVLTTFYEGGYSGYFVQNECRIGFAAFKGCSSLRKLEVDVSVSKKVSKRAEVNTPVVLGDSAFEKCKKLASVRLVGTRRAKQNAHLNAGRYTFYNCSNLRVIAGEEDLRSPYDSTYRNTPLYKTLKPSEEDWVSADYWD